MLRNLAEQFTDAATRDGMTGWHWTALAIDDAVAAGSAFVAPRRIREILNRWERDGVPAEYVDFTSRPADDASQMGREPVTSEGLVSHRSDRDGSLAPAPGVDEPQRDPVPDTFVIGECGMTSRQVWSAVLGDLQYGSVTGGGIGRTDIDTWLRDSAIAGRGAGGAVVVGVPHEIARRRAAGRYLGELRRAVSRVVGVDLEIEVILLRDWRRAGVDSAPDEIPDMDSLPKGA